MNDQTIKADAGKPKISLVPTQIVRDIAEVREYGLWKYGTAESWKKVEKQRYIDALCRHLLAYIDDPDGVDEESGIKHYKHMACNMAFICAMEHKDREPIQVERIPLDTRLYWKKIADEILHRSYMMRKKNENK